MNNLNLVRKIAYSFHSTTGIEMEELFSEACLAYSIAIKKHNPLICKESTFVYTCINNHLKNYIENIKKKMIPTLFIDDLKYDSAINLDILFEKLSREAQQIAHYILMTPFVYASMDSKKAKLKVLKAMAKKGVPLKNIIIGMNDLEKAFV